ncbi:MAG: zinc dependent phospholipase C family protein [Clostridiales bacterium]|nr:zinc dependent phospholipase C family protein [Clostridiales bacterium]
MRKKSHISLAKYMVDSLGDEELKKHKLSFYIGSILPDIKPSFLYKRHEITGTFPSIKKHIIRLSEGEKTVEKKGRKYYMDLGQISHYLADYFTFPHNTIYPGGLKEHCSYEEKLKNDLRSYIKSGEAGKLTDAFKNKQETHFHSAEALCRYIQDAHKDYLTKKHDVEDDIRHIVSVNHKALMGMLEVLAEKRAEWFLKHS